MRFQQTSYARVIVSAAVTLATTAVLIEPLISAWRLTATSPSALGGLLPWSDASVWLHGAHQLLNEGELGDWTIRRPLQPVFTSGLVALTGADLQWTLLLRTGLLAASCLLLLRELFASFGVIGAVVGFTVVASFASLFTPLLITEAAALVYGVAAAPE